MKKPIKHVAAVLLAVLLLTATSLCAFAADVAPFTFSAKADKTSANVGDTVSVSIVLSKDAPVSTITLSLKYDEASFEQTGEITEGALLSNANAAGVSFSPEPGVINIDYQTIKDFSAGGTLITAQFKVLKVNGEFKIEVKSVGRNDFDATEIKEHATVENVTIACAHATTKAETTKAATHTEEGVKTYTCTVCGATVKTEKIPALGHKFGEWKVTTPATCTKEGVETRECSCGVKETRKIEKTGHTPGEWTVTKEATCTEAGESKSTCTVCGAEITEAVPATGHTFGEWKEANGKKTRKCKVCGFEEVEKITAQTQTPGKKPAANNGNKSPNTGMAISAISVFSLLALAGGTAFAVKKKKEK